MKLIKYILLVLIYSFPLILLSQENLNNDNYFFSLRGYYGTVMPHHPEIQYIMDGRVRAFEVNFGFKTTGKKTWQQIHNYPSLGVGYLYSDFGNPDILGRSHSLFGFFNGNLFTKKRYSLRYNFELGAAYLTKYFDPETNHLNFVIGTPLNIHANLSIENRYQVTDRLQIFLGPGLYHFSNGGTKQPNLGINVLNISGGIRYFPNKEINISKKEEFPEYSKKFDFFLTLNFGGKGNDPAGVKSYFSSSLNLNAGRQLRHKYRIGAGTDIIFRDIKEDDYDGSMPVDSISVNRYFCGFHVSNDIIFDKLYFTVQQGVYLYPEKSLYNRFGFRYIIHKHFIASFTLFTHLFNAQRIELGFGYYF